MSPETDLLTARSCTPKDTCGSPERRRSSGLTGGHEISGYEGNSHREAGEAGEVDDHAEGETVDHHVLHTQG